jgi:hypothetical protein
LRGLIFQLWRYVRHGGCGLAIRWKVEVYDDVDGRNVETTGGNVCCYEYVSAACAEFAKRAWALTEELAM